MSLLYTTPTYHKMLVLPDNRITFAQCLLCQGCLYFCGFEAIFLKHSFTKLIKCSRIEKIKSIKCCLSEDLNGDVHWSGPTPSIWV